MKKFNFENVMKSNIETIMNEIFGEVPATNSPISIIHSSDIGYTIELEIPRIKKNEVEIFVEGSFLHVEVKSNTIKFGKKYSLPDDISTTNIKAKHEDGVLYINLFRIAKQRANIIIE